MDPLDSYYEKIPLMNTLVFREDYSTIEQHNAVVRLMALCKDLNKEVAVSSIRSLSKLAGYFPGTEK